MLSSSTLQQFFWAPICEVIDMCWFYMFPVFFLGMTVAYFHCALREFLEEKEKDKDKEEE